MYTFRGALMSCVSPVCAYIIISLAHAPSRQYPAVVAGSRMTHGQLHHFFAAATQLHRLSVWTSPTVVIVSPLVRHTCRIIRVGLYCRTFAYTSTVQPHAGYAILPALQHPFTAPPPPPGQVTAMLRGGKSLPQITRRVSSATEYPSDTMDIRQDGYLFALSYPQ